MSQNSDWDWLSEDQQKAVNIWREHAGNLLLAAAKDFECAYPDLRLTYNFTSEPLIRADHPVILEEL